MQPLNLLKFDLNIFLPSTPGSSKWSLYRRFPHKNPVYASLLPNTHYMTRPNHSSRFHPRITKSLTSEKWMSFYDVQRRAVKASSSQVRVPAILLLLNVGNYRLRLCGTLELENVLSKFRNNRSSVSNFKAEGMHTD